MDIKRLYTNGQVIFLLNNRWQLLVRVLIIFFFTFSFFSVIGFVPEYTNGSFESIATINSVEVEEVYESDLVQVPVHIEIPSANVDVNIERPESTDISVLDKALNKGAVQYPGTGNLTDDTNIFLFGHSSFLPEVINKNYQAFNNIGKLDYGDEIFVDSEDMRYVYRVTSVELAEASEIRIDIRHGSKKLTLSTCNSFGAESERFVVEADFVGSYLLTT